MNHSIILGIDEVGRGPWAGPLVVGAVILGEHFSELAGADHYEALTDSKKLTAKKRETLNQIILAHAAATGTGWVTTSEIDQYGLSPALKLATRRAVKQVLTQKIPFTEIIIDGTINLLDHTPLADRVTLLKKADALIKEVSAASIIAKVARDHYMTELDAKYPGYDFASHVGYGTAKHQSALEQLGPCPEHRRSFRPIRELIGQQNDAKTTIPQAPNVDNSTTRGTQAELAVAQYLENHGHKILAHNYKTKTYEIDLISRFNQNLYFTEVKYSRNPAQETTALVRITPAKQRQMQFAARTFLTSRPELQSYQPILAAASVHGANYQVETWFPLENS